MVCHISGGLVSMGNPIINPYPDQLINLVLSYVIELALSVLIFILIYQAFLRKMGTRRRMRMFLDGAAIFVLIFFGVYLVLNTTSYYYSRYLLS